MARGMSVMAMNPYGPNWIDKALEVAGGIGNIRGKQLINEEQRIKNAFLPQQTQSGLNLLGAKTALEEMQPDMLRAQMRNLDARSQLARAQAQFQGLGKDPLQDKRALLEAFEKAPPGSPESYLLSAILNKELGLPPGTGLGDFSTTAMGTASTPVLGALPTAVGGTTAPGGMPMLGAGSDLQLNPLSMGSRSKRGAQAGRELPDGTFETFESPTTTSAGRNQMRRESEAEMKTILPFMMNAIMPYQRFGGKLQFLKDNATYQENPNSEAGKAAAKRLEDFALAKKYFTEASNIISRQSSGQAPGYEAMREQKKSLFSGLPGDIMSFIIPKDIENRATQRYQPLQESATEAALEEERTGYQKNLKETPYWAQQEGQQFIPAMFTPYGFQPGRLITPQRQPETQASTPKQATAPQQQEYSEADIAHTAKKYNMTTDQVKQMLGAR